MAKLVTDSNLADPDAVYRRFVDAHRGLADAESHALNARLVLILANHVGDIETIDAAIRLAKDAAEPPRAAKT